MLESLDACFFSLSFTDEFFRAGASSSDSSSSVLNSNVFSAIVDRSLASTDDGGTLGGSVDSSTLAAEAFDLRPP